MSTPVLCDFCDLPIETLDDAWIEWWFFRPDLKVMRGIRLVHHYATSNACPIDDRDPLSAAKHVENHHGYVFVPARARHAAYVRKLGRDAEVSDVVDDILRRVRLLARREPPERRREHRARFLIQEVTYT